jgi:hypothetical protein
VSLLPWGPGCRIHDLIGLAQYAPVCGLSLTRRPSQVMIERAAAAHAEAGRGDRV